MNSICIFCGANFNGDPLLKQTVEQLAEVMVNQNITLVYAQPKFLDVTQNLYFSIKSIRYVNPTSRIK